MSNGSGGQEPPEGFAPPPVHETGADVKNLEEKNMEV